MAWIVIADDSDKGPALRADAGAMAEMWAYELANRDVIIAAGSLRADDGVTKTGSMFILSHSTRQEVEAFLAADPASTAGLRGTVTIRWANLAILDGVVQG